MSEVIKTTDYEGVRVYCTASQWNEHIVERHSIMRHNQHVVSETINSPDTVCNSEDYENRKIFFKQATCATYSSKLKTKVIVEYKTADSEKVGEVVTAFPVKEVKGGIGDVIFP